MPHIHQINVNPAGGVPKYSVPAAMLGSTGVAGDKQRNLKYHGGPKRAVCLYSLELIKSLQAEGHPIQPGHVGENLTISGLEWDSLAPGTTLRIGEEVEIRITDYTVPCSNIAFAFADRKSVRISQDLHPGWARLYARVLRTGEVRVGDSVTVVQMPPSQP
ncbi:MAG: MOSC domain-containing protein [Burkholderiales bacterium]|nr:MOSC domain-containing protein [Phycisphaerae bacterium]